MGAVIAQHFGNKRGVKKHHVWLDATTHKTLKDICGATITIAAAGSAPLKWQQVTERKLESRFGRLRSMFGTSVMSMADYWRASQVLMQRDKGKVYEPQGPRLTPVTEEQYVQCSERAWSSVRKLFALSSNLTTHEVQAIFEATHGSLAYDEEDEDDVQGEGRVVFSKMISSATWV